MISINYYYYTRKGANYFQTVRPSDVSRGDTTRGLDCLLGEVTQLSESRLSETRHRQEVAHCAAAVRTISDDVIAVPAQQRCTRSRIGSAVDHFLSRFPRFFSLSFTNIPIITSLHCCCSKRPRRHREVDYNARDTGMQGNSRKHSLGSSTESEVFCDLGTK